MIKIGIVTFTYGDNYGQRLQNYAVQELLKGKGANVFTLRQPLPKYSVPYRFRSFMMDLIHGDWGVKRKRHKSFSDFDATFIQYGESCPAKGECSPEIRTYDAFVAGSDQIWSPYLSDPEGIMFLSFAGDAKRISLSASIAAPEIPAEKRYFYQKWLNKFDLISVRENNAGNIVKKLIGKDVPVLIDPTLMFDARQWSRIAKTPHYELPGSYALKYFLGSDSEKLYRFEAYCKREGLQIIDLCADKRFYSEGPSEFLYLIQHASLVATDSFHGSIFTLLFGIPLLLFDRNGSAYNMTDRFDTLAQKMGLGDWREYNWKALENGGPKVLDINHHLMRERKSFEKFLDESLKIIRQEIDAHV